ncbi:MAG: carboxypeptidase-like regulatory domain-containing protein, partial [Flavobacteriaceae bacterium]
MKKRSIQRIIYFLSLILVIPICSAQEPEYSQFRGEVVDASSNKPLVFATLGVDGTNISTITNSEGEFLLKV